MYQSPTWAPDQSWERPSEPETGERKGSSPEVVAFPRHSSQTLGLGDACSIAVPCAFSFLFFQIHFILFQGEKEKEEGGEGEGKLQQNFKHVNQGPQWCVHCTLSPHCHPKILQQGQGACNQISKQHQHPFSL